MNPDHLRTNQQAVRFVRQMFDDGKPIAAICHGPWTLVEPTSSAQPQGDSFPSIKTDMKNAGAEWVDERVVVDRGMVTSRKPDDIPAFNKRWSEFKEGKHGGAGKRQNARTRA